MGAKAITVTTMAFSASNTSFAPPIPVQMNKWPHKNFVKIQKNKICSPKNPSNSNATLQGSAVFFATYLFVVEMIHLNG